MKEKAKILIYGTGVIGSIYATKLAKAGYDISVYACGLRLQVLQQKGLLYSDKSQVKKANVKVTDKVKVSDVYDFILVAVKYQQIEGALKELATNMSPNVVTMVNNPKGYQDWEQILGKGRLLPAFAGAGGRIEDDVLHYTFTPRIIQSTTCGEIDGSISTRLLSLIKVMRSCKITCRLEKDMDAWQKSHLALVLPLSNAIYFDGGDNYSTAKNTVAIQMMATELQSNFQSLKNKKITITPAKLNVLYYCPLWLLKFMLKVFCATKLAAAVSGHLPYIEDEIAQLNSEFYKLLKLS